MSYCPETRLRIRLAVAAWAYEMHADPLMSDAEYDRLSRQVDLDKSTENNEMDEWFIANFTPDSGMWVRSHPGRDGLERLYRLLRGQTAWERILLRLTGPRP